MIHANWEILTKFINSSDRITVHIPKETRPTYAMHGTKCRYLGESPNHKSSIFIECATNRIIYSRDAIYFPDWKSNPTCSEGFDVTFPEDFSHESTDPDIDPENNPNYSYIPTSSNTKVPKKQLPFMGCSV
jgi:hypothetical protein